MICGTLYLIVSDHTVPYVLFMLTALKRKITNRNITGRNALPCHRQAVRSWILSMVRRRFCASLTLDTVYVQMMINENDVSCEGFEERLGIAVCEEVLVRNKICVLLVPRLLCWTTYIIVKVVGFEGFVWGFFNISYYLEPKCPSCRLISLVSCCMMFSLNGSYWAWMYT